MAWEAAKAAPAEEGKKQWQATAVEIAEGLATATKTLNAQLLAGEARSTAGDWEAARRWFDAAAALAPDDPLPRFYQARCAAGLGGEAEALSLLDETFAKKPDADLSRRAYDLKGYCHHKLKQYAEAAAAYRKAGDPEKAKSLEAAAGQARQAAGRLADCEKHLTELKTMLAEGREVLNPRDIRALEQRIEETTAECRQYRGSGASQP
jgi:tetratricopeptide (TPR) repeat protein